VFTRTYFYRDKKIGVFVRFSLRRFTGYGYIPEGKALYTGWHEDHVIIDPIIDVKYDEAYLLVTLVRGKLFSHFYNFGLACLIQRMNTAI
jgi:beta-glucosidase